jgi:hypothetical protein
MAVSRILLAIALLFSGICGDEDAPPPLPPPPPPDLILTDSQVEGCYEHVPRTPGEPPMRHVAPWEAPERFYLRRSEISIVNNPPKGGKITQTDTYPASGHWQRTDDNAIRLTWTNGAEGIRVTLRRSSTDGWWRGHTEPFSNMGGVVIRNQVVVVRRVADVACQ